MASYLRLINKTKGKDISSQTTVAKSFYSRLMGLMFRQSMGDQEALVFYKASSIHMFFMFMAIDVIYLDKDMKVMKIVRGLKPWLMSSCFGAYCTIELPAGKSDGLISQSDELAII